MIREELVELHFSDPEEPSPIFYDGLDDAIIGVTSRKNEPSVIAYSYDAIVTILMERDGVSCEDAIEYIDYNISSNWMGDMTPILIGKDF
jgi:hypothetical protein